MDTIDQAAEWRRLEELYRSKSDDELEVVADDAYELTDIARQILEREIATRGLKIELKPQPMLEPDPDPEPAFNPEAEDFDPKELDWVAGYRVWDREEARKIKAIYNDAGVASFLGPELVEDVDQFKGSFDKGVVFRVREVDSPRASAAIRWALRDEPVEAPETERDVDYRCPKCGSNEIVFENLERETPEQEDFQAHFQWHCDACGHEWTDDGVED
jgi:DNA-directed RNA polymerase subunit M/transcription elongation factor TFIIS